MGTDGKSNGAANGSIRLPKAGSTKGAVNFPNSRKVHAEGRGGVRVPMREIALAGGEPPRGACRKLR